MGKQKIYDSFIFGREVFIYYFVGLKFARIIDDINVCTFSCDMFGEAWRKCTSIDRRIIYRFNTSPNFEKAVLFLSLKHIWKITATTATTATATFYRPG